VLFKIYVAKVYIVGILAGGSGVRFALEKSLGGKD
jgi:hypothetical protein